MTNDSFNARVLIRRNADSNVVEYVPDYRTNIHVWENGNFSCDCNRKSFFDGDYGSENECGEDKYSIQLYDADTGELLVNEFEDK
jgi:hypothetical protein